MFIKIMMWVYLKVIGVRFHQLSYPPMNHEYRHTQCILYNGNTVTFKFHVTEHEVYRYVRNRLYKKKVESLLIHAVYSEDLPEEFKRWNDIAFSFPGVPVWMRGSRVVSDTMLLAYLDFINKKSDEIV